MICRRDNLPRRRVWPSLRIRPISQCDFKRRWWYHLRNEPKQICINIVQPQNLYHCLRRRTITEGVDIEHPRNKAQNLVKTSGTLVFNTRRTEVRGGVATYCSAAAVNKEEIALMEGCASAEEAEVKVAHLVIEKLKF